jgi:hypothetical protein
MQPNDEGGSDEAGDDDDAAGSSRLSVYDGRHRLGTIEVDDHTFRAFDNEDHTLGDFPSLAEAQAAFTIRSR